MALLQDYSREAPLVNKFIDLRSDTVTVPTDEMRRAMAAAEVGDDVYGEDPTINRLEQLAAEKVGKEAALFVPTGTMGNQVSVMTHTRRGDEVVLESEAHIFLFEVGGLAVLSGAQAHTVKGVNGVMDPADVEAAIRGEDIHHPRTAVVCLENTHNRAGGTVIPQETIDRTCEIAHRHGAVVHVDGARLFNASVASGVSAARILRDVDSVQFCLSKGLSAPVGSIVAGSRDYIARARKNRKLLGGGMRQAGVLAAAGIVALTKMIDRLAEDHANARTLAEGVAAIPGLTVNLATVQTNIVQVSIDRPGLTGSELAANLTGAGVKCGSTGSNRIRLVTHKDVNRDDIVAALAIIAQTMKA